MKTGLSDQRRGEIASGPTHNERVAVNGPVGLHDGCCCRQEARALIRFRCPS